LNNKNKTILIADDDEDIREALAHVLEDQGYQVEQAINGLRALKILRTKTIDLLITDLLMPDMDGLELVNHIKNDHSELPFILISGGGRQFNVDEGFNYLDSAKLLTNARHVLRKPFEAEELITAVSELLP